MKKIYLEPRTEAMEIENEGMLCDSDASTGVKDTPADGAALTREDEWDDEWI